MKTLTRFSLALSLAGLLNASLFAQVGMPPAGATPGTVGPWNPSLEMMPGAPTPYPGQAPLMDPPGNPGAIPINLPSSFGQPPGACPPEPCEECQETPKCCFEIFGDLLYWKARGVDLIFGQPRDGATTLSAPRGPQGILEPDYSPGFRAGVCYAISDCSSIEAAFALWECQTNAFLKAPNNPPGTIIQSTTTLPSIMNSAANGLSAKAGMGIQYRSGTLSYSHFLLGNPGCYAVSWLVGGRYGYMRQDFAGSYSILGTTDVDSRLSLEGAGPMAGLQGEVVCCGGFRIFGKSTASALASHLTGHYNQFNVFAGNQGFIDYATDRIVTLTELETGIAWVSPKGHLSLSAGYYVGCWFNTITMPDYINAVQQNNYSTSGGNLESHMTFDGLTFRVEVRF